MGTKYWKLLTLIFADASERVGTGGPTPQTINTLDRCPSRLRSIHLVESITSQEVRKMADDYGVINLTDVKRAPRGATAEYEDGLLTAMTATLKQGKVVTANVHAVLRSDFPATEEGQSEFGNAKQAKAAMFRSHFDHLVATGALSAGKIGIDWDPDSGVAQIRFKRA